MPGYSYAFQPIVDVLGRRVVSYEALIRGAKAESAASVLQAVPAADLYRFDEASRVTAVELAARLRCDRRLNLNFLPRGLQASDTAIESTVAAARRCGIALERIVIEVTEAEVVDNPAYFSEALNAYRCRGLRVAIDDFGAGYSGLNLLADFQPDEVKLDMHLVRGIAHHGPRQAIVRGIRQVCIDLGIDLIAEGVEDMAECLWLVDEGIHLLQGYLFARPGFESLPQPQFPPL